MGRVTDWAETMVARRFVERLSGLAPPERWPVLAPVLNRHPYLSAWTNVEAALGSAPAEDRLHLGTILGLLDVRVEALDMDPTLREAARRAVRALLARRWLLTPESLKFVYEPFESSIPLDSLGS